MKLLLNLGEYVEAGYIEFEIRGLTTGLLGGKWRFSPDGKCMAYISDESGRFEVYVQPYPGPGGKWQISTEGGVEPVWARNGRELFYRNGDQMMAVEITTDPIFSAGRPGSVDYQLNRN